MTQRFKIYISLSLLILAASSCKKFLDAKPSTSLSTISTVADAQALLDNYTLINEGLPFDGEVSADNYYFPNYFFENYGYATQTNGALYIWSQDPYDAVHLGGNNSWSSAYSVIMNTNTALYALDKIAITSENRESANNAKGDALAIRGYYFWKLAVTFSKSYNTTTAGSDLGISLRTGTEIYTKLNRSSVQETYAQILNDLTTALSILPVKPAAITRPSKPAVYGMLSEVYLSMRNYPKAQAYADSSLILINDLIDFNTLDKTSTSPVPLDNSNKEVLIGLGSAEEFSVPNVLDTTLLASYHSNDLRKRLWFSDNGDGTYSFSGRYFSGGSVDCTCG
jgi:hypothetical protein